MKILNCLTVALLATCALSVHAEVTEKNTPAATGYGQHLAFEKACKGVDGVHLVSMIKKDVFVKHLSQGGKKTEFNHVVSTYTKATEQNLASLDKSDLSKACKEYSNV